MPKPLNPSLLPNVVNISRPPAVSAAFHRAQQINHSLIALYKLLAQGRIAPRQAAVLAYIGSLVLRSLKAVDYDLDRFDDEPGEKPPAKPVAAHAVRPGKEPLPATAQEFAAKVLERKPN